MTDMDFSENTTPQEEQVVAGNPLAPTIMEKLRAQRAEAVPDTVDINIPGYQEMLVGRYGIISGKDLASIGKKVSRQFKDRDDQNLYATVDLIISSCQGLYYRNLDVDGGEDLIPLSPDYNPETNPDPTPMTFQDARLAEFLGFRAETAREAVFQTFKQNDSSIIAHGMLLTRWFADTSKEVDETFLLR